MAGGKVAATGPAWLPVLPGPGLRFEAFTAIPTAGERRPLDYPGAVRLLEEILAVDPQHEAATLELARVQALGPPPRPTRIAIPGGHSLDLETGEVVEGDWPGGLTYMVFRDGATLDVAGGDARLAGPFRETRQQFHERVADDSFVLEDGLGELFPSEVIVPAPTDRTDGRKSTAVGCFLLARRPDGLWSALYVLKAGRSHLLVEFAAKVTP